MRFWMDVMRGLEPVIEDHERLFDAWEAAGVRGLVVGPMTFDATPLGFGARRGLSSGTPCATFDPDPRICQALGVEPPPAPEQQHPERRRGLEQMLTAARDRGWSVWIFTPAAGMGPGGDGHIFADERSQAAFSARMADTLAHYPMADGGIMDGPEWGYEIAPHHMNHRSFIFNDLPPTVEPACVRLGYDYAALVAAKDRLFARLHDLPPRRIELDAPGGLLGAFSLFGSDPDLLSWLAFRVDAMTGFYRGVRQQVDAHVPHRVRLGLGPRSACFGSLAGYDFERLAEPIDVLLPKHYFWHRGFDGMYGTVGRYVETLCLWNPELTDAQALQVVKALFGLELPGVGCRRDLDDGFPPEFFATVVPQETRRAIAAVGDADRVVPWVDAGRRPHDGDPMTAGDLGRMLVAAREAGLRWFLYHHHGNVTAGEWAVLSELCGEAWQAVSSDFEPPDAAIL